MRMRGAALSCIVGGMTIDREELRRRLLEERATLLKSLGKIAGVNPDNPDDLIPLPPELDTVQADQNDLADRSEDFGERRSTELTLEDRLNNVKLALSKIESGTYGACETCGEPIESERLGANPAARTCVKHR